MRPKVIRSATPRVLFYPVRRACSSAIQLALGYDFCDWRDVAHGYSSFHRFTCYRNTFDRLRSLYYNFVNPAPQGRVDFLNNGEVNPDFKDWILQVAETDDATCNEHLHSQDWHLVVPNLDVWQFGARKLLFTQLLKKTSPQLGKASPDLSHLTFDMEMLHDIEHRYPGEIETFRYAP